MKSLADFASNTAERPSSYLSDSKGEKKIK